MRVNMPLISVIVPAYNAEKWIAECIASVFAQSYPNIELIIINDGSNDGTFGIAEKESVGRDNVKIIHTENCGVSSARNIGIEAAQGEYITFLDADDLLMPNALSVLYDLLTENDCGIAIAQKVNEKSDGRQIPNCFPNDFEIWSGTDGLKHSLEDHPAAYSVWGKLYKREILRDIRFTEGRSVHEDSFFIFLCMMKQPRVVVKNECVLRYRLSENSASRSPFSEKFFDILYFAERKKELVEREYPEFLGLTHNLMIKANMALLRCLCKTYDPKYRGEERSCIKAILADREYFVPAVRADENLFWFITHRLYWLYRLMYIIRMKIG